MENRHIGGIDLVRFATALMVMAFHLCFWSWGSRGTSFIASGGVAQYPELKYLTWFGGVGVEIFFVISGFVIAYSAHDKTAWQFFQSRFWRIYPMVWVCAPLTFLVLVAVGIDLGLPPLILLARSIVIYPFSPWVDGVYWSLAIELTFYLLVLLLLLLRLRNFFEPLAVALIVAGLSYFVGITFFDVSRLHQIWLLPYSGFFGLGIVFWLMRENGLKFRYFLLAGTTVAMTFLELNSLLGGRSPILLCSWFAVWCIGALAIFCSSQYPFLGNSTTRALGLLTYPLYLLHDVIGCAILRIAPHVGRWPALLLAAASVVLLAYAAMLIEPYLRGALKALFTTKPVKAPA